MIFMLIRYIKIYKQRLEIYKLQINLKHLLILNLEEIRIRA